MGCQGKIVHAPAALSEYLWFAVEKNELNLGLDASPQIHPLSYGKSSERRVEKSPRLCGQAGPLFRAYPRKQDALAD